MPFDSHGSITNSARTYTLRTAENRPLFGQTHASRLIRTIYWPHAHASQCGITGLTIADGHQRLDTPRPAWPPSPRADHLARGRPHPSSSTGARNHVAPSRLAPSIFNSMPPILPTLPLAFIVPVPAMVFRRKAALRSPCRSDRACTSCLRTGRRCRRRAWTPSYRTRHNRAP